MRRRGDGGDFRGGDLGFVEWAPPTLQYRRLVKTNKLIRPETGGRGKGRAQDDDAIPLIPNNSIPELFSQYESYVYIHPNMKIKRDYK